MASKTLARKLISTIIFSGMIALGAVGCGGGGGGGGSTSVTPPPPEIPIVPADDHGDSRADATTLVLGRSLPGVIETVGDEDYFRVNVTELGTLTVYTTGRLDSVGKLQAADGSILATDDNSGADNNFRIEHLVNTGTYYVKVNGEGTVSSTGAYIVHTRFVAGSSPPVDDHGNSRSDATGLALGSSSPGEIETVGDEDYFRVNVAELGTLTIYTTGFLNSVGELQAADGFVLATDDNSGTDNNFKIERLVDPGTYYVKVKGYESVDANGTRITFTGPYIVRTGFVAGPAPPVDDHSNSRHGATEIALGSSLPGEIGVSGDEDYFRVNVTEPGTLTVYTTGNLDTYGHLSVPSYDDSGDEKNFRISADIVHPGTYFIGVGANLRATGSYVVWTHFVGFPPDQHGNTRADATPIPVGGSVPGEIWEEDDDDFFRVEVPRPGRLRVIVSCRGLCNELVGEVQAADGVRLGNLRSLGYISEIWLDVTPGTYYVRIGVGDLDRRHIYDVTPHFRGSLPPQTDDHGDTRADATALPLGSSVAGELGGPEDKDYFRLNVTRPGTLTVYTTGGVDTVGELQSADGTRVASDDGRGDRSNFKIVSSVDSGTYFVRVSSGGGGGGSDSHGNYFVLADFGAPLPADDHGDTRADATLVPLGGSVAGEIWEDADDDFFRIVIPQRGTLSVYAREDEHSGVGFVRGELYAADGRRLRETNKLGPGANFGFELGLDPGTYFVRVYTYVQRYGTAERYVVHADFVASPPDDHGDTRADATSLALGGSVSGVMEASNDKDFFRVEVTRPGWLIVHTTGHDLHTRLRTPDGALLARNYDHSNRYILGVQYGVVPGTYYVEASVRSLAGLPASYTVFAQFFPDGAPDGHGDSKADATVLPLESSVPGAIEQGDDVDFFRLEVTARGTLTVSTTGGFFTKIGELQSADGTVLRCDCQAYRRSGADKENFAMEDEVFPGTYYVKVGSHGDARGSYVVHARFEARAPDDHGDTRADATSLALGGSVSGVIEVPGDHDFFRVEVVREGTLTIDMMGDRPTDPFASGELQTADGAPLASHLMRYRTSGGSFEIVALVKPGTYYVKVASHGYGDSIGSYVVQARFVAAAIEDHSDTPQGASAVAFGETVGGSIDSPGDVDYFRYTITEPGVVDIAFTAAQGAEIAALDEMGNVLASGVVGQSASTRPAGLGTLGTRNVEALQVGRLVLQIGVVVGPPVLIRVTSKDVLAAATYSIVGFLTGVVSHKVLNLRVQQGAPEWQVNLDEYYECVRNGQRLNRNCKLSYEVSAITRLTSGSTEVLSHTLTQENSLRFNPSCTQPLGEYAGKKVVKLFGFTISTVSFKVEVFDEDEKLCVPEKIDGSPSLSVSVPQGGNVAIDLSDYIEDPRRGQLTLTPGESPPGTAVILSGSIWTIAASGDADAGEHQLPITATSIKGGIEKSSDFTLQVIVEGELGAEWIRARNVDCHAHRTSLSRLKLLRDDQPAPYTYSGGCSQRKVHGQGTATLADTAVGDARYSGEWRDGHASGQGILTLPSGNRYVGEFLDGLRHGQGTWTHVDGFHYEGEWSDGVLSGQGTATWPDGSRYVGEWREGRQNGQGTWTHPNGDNLEGEWLNGGFANVRGTWTRPSDGTRFQGTWRFGQFCDGWEYAPDGGQAFYRDCQVVSRR